MSLFSKPIPFHVIESIRTASVLRAELHFVPRLGPARFKIGDRVFTLHAGVEGETTVTDVRTHQYSLTRILSEIVTNREASVYLTAHEIDEQVTARLNGQAVIEGNPFYWEYRTAATDSPDYKHPAMRWVRQSSLCAYNARRGRERRLVSDSALRVAEANQVVRDLHSAIEKAELARVEANREYLQFFSAYPNQFHEN